MSVTPSSRTASNASEPGELRSTGSIAGGLEGRVGSPTLSPPGTRPKRRTSMGKFTDQRIYRTFEEFEREELRRDGYFESVDSMIDDMFAGAVSYTHLRAHETPEH